ncbi:MAG: hypothetical protein RL748_1590 [Pseudomonadota bacterium]
MKSITAATMLATMLAATLGTAAICFPAQAADEPIELKTPAGGWNYGGLTDKSGDTRVAYPTPPINRGAQRARRLIEGSIRNVGKERRGQLIVNGNPTVLNTDENGKFQRFYAFGSGSNGLEVKNAAGQSRRVQFYEANPNQITPQLRIICSWDAPEAEVDLHIVTPDGQHAFFGRPVLNGGGGLDVDSVDGPGPEMFTTAAPLHGAYHVFVNYWGNYGPGGYNFDAKNLQKPIITTRITLVYFENSAKEKRESFVIPLRKIGDVQLVKSFLF